MNISQKEQRFVNMTDGVGHAIEAKFCKMWPGVVLLKGHRNIYSGILWALSLQYLAQLHQMLLIKFSSDGLIKLKLLIGDHSKVMALDSSFWPLTFGFAIKIDAWLGLLPNFLSFEFLMLFHFSFLIKENFFPHEQTTLDISWLGLIRNPIILFLHCTTGLESDWNRLLNHSQGFNVSLLSLIWILSNKASNVSYFKLYWPSIAFFVADVEIATFKTKIQKLLPTDCLYKYNYVKNFILQILQSFQNDVVEFNFNRKMTIQPKKLKVVSKKLILFNKQWSRISKSRLSFLNELWIFWLR